MHNYIKFGITVLIIFIFNHFAISSTFAVNFVKDPNSPILTPSSSTGTWDKTHVQNSFISINNNEYKIWYDGNGGLGWRIGFATSNDNGITWNKLPTPIITPSLSSNWEKEVAEPTIIITSLNQYQMWYNSINTDHVLSGSDRFRTRHATSNNGIDWIPGDWVLTGNIGSWDTGGTARGRSIIYKDGLYHMWYSATNDNNLVSNPYWRIGYAISENGLVWNKQNNNNPVIEPTTSWELNNVSYPKVIFDAGIYKMWYAASTNDLPTQIVYAFSTDGITWEKPASENPVLTRGPAGSFDSTYVANPFVLKDGNVYKMWYSGFNGSNWSIGYASTGPFPPPSPTTILTPTPTLTPTSMPSPTPTSTPTPTLTPTPTPPPTTKMVFIPGFGATWNSELIMNCQPGTGNELWTLNPLAKQIYNPLLQNLKNSNVTVLPLYYDWRRTPIQTSGYLASLIQSSRQSNEKVNLLAHSFGGLVARAYIDQTQNDSQIDTMLTVGTPHKGIVESYLPWAGGNIPEWIASNLLLRFGIESALHFCASNKSITPLDAIHLYSPSAERLLPTFDYLRDKSSRQLKPNSKMFYKNNWLLQSNFSFPYYGIHMGTLAGTDQRTLKELSVKQPRLKDIRNKLWIDGEPYTETWTDQGDNTVLLSSAQLPNAINKTLRLSHNALVMAPQGIEAIRNYFRILSPAVRLNTTTYTEPADGLILMADAASFSVANADMTITADQDGIITMIHPTKGKRKIAIRPNRQTARFVVAQFLKNGNTLWKEYLFKGTNITQYKTLTIDQDNPKEDTLK